MSTAQNQVVPAGGAENNPENLTDMHRKYRIMESNRKNYAEDSQSIIKKQRTTITKYKEDNENLKLEIAAFGKEAAILGLKMQQKMNEYQDEADIHSRKIELERRRLEELERQITLAESKCQAKRRALGGVNATYEIDQQVNRQIKVLEARLDKALVKFNEALSNNKSLREEIDHLRRERHTFETVYKKLDRELHERKKEMVNVIEISNIAYEARDQAQNEITALQAQNDKETAIWEEEKRQLNLMIEHEREIMENKQADTLTMGGMSMDEEAELKKKVTKGVWGVGKAKAVTDNAHDKVQMYDDAFAKIQAATGLTDINELVTSFINAEDQNFSLFNFANELNQETEKLEEQMAELKVELGHAKAREATTEGERQAALGDLEGSLGRTEEKGAAYNARLAASQIKVDALKERISSMFDQLGCSLPESPEQPEINDNTLLMFLGVIEQRANEVIQIAASSTLHKTDPTLQHGTVLGTGPSAPIGSSNVDILPPSTAEERHSDEESDEDIDDRPLDRDELQARTLKSINKRESKAAQRRNRKK